MTESTGVFTSVDQLLNCRQNAQGMALTARKESRAMANGAVRTRYRGRGMEFAEVRPYQPGDDIRAIDWRVTARVQSPYTKLFQEEHERPVFIMVDQRSPMFFGSTTVFKSVFAAQLAASVAWIAQANNERVGALVFGDARQHDIRPRRGKHAVLEFINHLASYNQALHSPAVSTMPNSLYGMLEDTSRVAKPGSMVVMISDFHDFTDQCREPLSMLAKRSDVLAVHVFDRLERQLPNFGRLAVSNKTQQLAIDPKKIGHEFENAFARHTARIQRAFTNCAVQYASASLDITADEYVRDLFHRKNGSLSGRGGKR